MDWQGWGGGGGWVGELLSESKQIDGFYGNS